MQKQPGLHLSLTEVMLTPAQCTCICCIHQWRSKYFLNLCLWERDHSLQQHFLPTRLSSRWTSFLWWDALTSKMLICFLWLAFPQLQICSVKIMDRDLKLSNCLIDPWKLFKVLCSWLMYVCAGTVEWSLGNKESDFRETRHSFKHVSNSPQLIELLLKENKNEVRNTPTIHYITSLQCFSKLCSHLSDYTFCF